MAIHLPNRPRRNRKHQVIRDMISETKVQVHDLIFPLFVTEGSNIKEEIPSMPGIYRYSKDMVVKEVASCIDLGIKAFAPFPAIDESKKDPYATESYNPDGLYINVIKEIKERFPEVIIMSDVAMDPYNSDGHDGIVRNGEILNDATLEVLGKMAVTQAYAGADIIGPSDMMDGRVAYIRDVLDHHELINTSIMSYSTKYASAFYGPFRDALNSAPKAGDKKTYQMDPSNHNEALREAALDEQEGADFLMVKPAMPYLDVIQDLKAQFTLPIAAYQVSGEYAMIKAAGQNGWLDEEATMHESLLSIKRAGADAILTYFAKAFAQFQARL